MVYIRWGLGKCHALRALGIKVSYFNSSALVRRDLWIKNVQIYEFGTEKLN
jgi:hypothetical protein